ncbi:MAG: TIGR04086 family membrane protein [Oscillospiraceae bacterium]|nr:TIGR04086 family membrane protein [Oscillospiraceae bacterium]
MPAKHQKKRGSSPRIYLLSVIFGVLAGGFMTAFFSFLIWFLQLPVAFADGFSAIAFGVCCLVSGITAGKLKGRHGLSGGLKAAMIILVVFAVVTLVTGNFSGGFVLGRAVTAVICGATGGVIGVNGKRV